jgi:hypothetical protein
MLQHPTFVFLRPGSHENFPRDSRTNFTEISDLFTSAAFVALIFGSARPSGGTGPAGEQPRRTAGK